MSSVNIAQLLAVCVRASLAAQRYVMLDLVKLPDAEAKMAAAHAQGPSPPASAAASPSPASAAPRTVLELSAADRATLVASLHGAVGVDVKSHLDYKEGDAADDLVTTADVLTQAVVLQALSHAFPTMPFTVVGEEDQPNSAVAAQAAACVATHYAAIPVMPFESDMYAHVRAHARPGVEEGEAAVVHAASDAAMRQRLGVFIDPIDGTNCFVGGVWQAPMTLVGVSLDGVPVAGVVNRVFYYPLTASPTSTADAAACVPSLSVLLNPPTLAAPFVVFDGELQPAPVAIQRHPVCTPDTALAVTRSSTTKKAFLQETMARLEPCTSVCARGAGYKQYHLIKRMLAGRHVPQEALTPCDVFVCPPSTIKKWDCCAPHAFLYALGGDIFDHKGAPLRYPLGDGRCDASPCELAALPDGLVAVTPYARQEVARRLGWTAAADL